VLCDIKCECGGRATVSKLTPLFCEVGNMHDASFKTLAVTFLSSVLFSLVIAQYRESAPAGVVPPALDNNVQLAIKIALIVIGFIFVIAGYRIFQVTLFIIGLILGFATTYLVLTTHAEIALWLVLVLSLVGGLLLGLLFLCVLLIGVFAVGAYLGLAAACTLLATPLGTTYVTSNVAHLLIILGASVLCGVLALIAQKTLLILGTSLFGAYCMAVAIDSLWVHSDFSQIIPNIISAQKYPLHESQLWISLAFLGGILLVTLIGVIVQFRVFAKHWDHRKKRKRVSSEDGQPLLESSINY
jgi:hypothetical protein